MSRSGPTRTLRSLVLNRWYIGALALGLACSSPQATVAVKAAPSVEERLRDDVTRLASTDLQGRRAGSAGADEAALWIASRYGSLGLEPAGTNHTYLQPFDLRPTRRLTGLPIEKAIPAAVDAEGAHRTLLGLDSTNLAFTLASAPGLAKGKIVDVGDGDRYDEKTWDSPEPKIALARLRTDAPGASLPAGHGGVTLPASLRSLAFVAKQHKAAGLIVLVPAKGDIPNESGDDHDLGLPILFATASAEPILLRCDAFHFDAGVEAIPRKTQNVLALVPGAASAAEVLVVGAHYDHLGMGGNDSLAPGVNAIHPGADDNASGTALVLELARRFARKGGDYPRAILFASWGAEELGLLGSKYWVKSPTVPWDRVVANVNFDMVGRSTNGKLDIGGVSTAVGWKEIVEDANQTLAKPLGVRTSSRLSGIGGSDHMSFGEASRPALFFFTGLHSDYHKPSDTADKINYATMAQIADLAEGVIERIARSPRIEYVKPPEPPPESGPTSRGAERGLRTWLGTIPDYGAEEGGVVLSGTSAGSPAQRAGMQAKDILKKVGSFEIRDINDLTEALARLKPGDEVEVQFLRDGTPQKLTLTLGARK